MTKEELEKENANLKVLRNYELNVANLEIEKLEKVNTELIQENEEIKKGLGCETCQIHLEFTKLNQKITELKALIKSEHEIEARKNNSLVSQVTKAKEIIKKMLYEYQRLCLIKKETLTEAEQFIKNSKPQTVNN